MSKKPNTKLTLLISWLRDYFFSAKTSTYFNHPQNPKTNIEKNKKIHIISWYWNLHTTYIAPTLCRPVTRTSKLQQRLHPEQPTEPPRISKIQKIRATRTSYQNIAIYHWKALRHSSTSSTDFRCHYFYHHFTTPHHAIKFSLVPNTSL